MAYSGKYHPKNKEKYEGDVNNIIYRSLWERHVLKWCDLNPDVLKYSSEEVIVPYICKTDGRKHRYFVDMKIKFKNGPTLLVEIKPNHQTKPPQFKGRRTRKYLTEVMTYAKNKSKWDAATEFAEERGWVFQIWDEFTIESITGIKLSGKKNKSV